MLGYTRFEMTVIARGLSPVPGANQASTLILVGQAMTNLGDWWSERPRSFFLGGRRFFLSPWRFCCSGMNGEP